MSGHDHFRQSAAKNKWCFWCWQKIVWVLQRYVPRHWSCPDGEWIVLEQSCQESKSSVHAETPPPRTVTLLSFILLDVWNMVVDITEASAPWYQVSTWFKGTATHGNDDGLDWCTWREVVIVKRSPSFEYPHSFIEEDRCIESFDLLDQAVAQFFTLLNW